MSTAKVWLITGGSGSFGKAFTKSLLEDFPHMVKQIRIFSRDEYKQFQMQEEFKDRRIEWLIGDVRDSERLQMAMSGVDICIHAAAMKRIEKCERDPNEAKKTNVDGTINVATAALVQGVTNCILISTDKAAYPVNTYGKTKALAESLWNQHNVYRGANKVTKFSVVRYGNVVGSRGSMLPVFQEQAKTGILKVTSAEMTRYLITLKQAVDLVHAAIELQQGGEIFLPQLKSVNIYDLATTVVPNMRVEFVGLRAGEKMHEVLFTKEEASRISCFDQFCIINPEFPTWAYSPHEATPIPFTTSEQADRYTDEELTQLLNA